MALRMSCWPCKSCDTDCCSSMISRATAEAGCGAINCPANAPRNTAATTIPIVALRDISPPCRCAGVLELIFPERPAIRLVVRPYSFSLLRAHEVRTPILLPAGFIRLRAERLLFTIAHSGQAIGGNSELHQEIACGLCTPLAETEIVFRRAALVAMALDAHLDLR